VIEPGRHRPGVDVVVVAYRQPAQLQRFIETLRRWPPIVEMSWHIVEVDPIAETVLTSEPRAVGEHTTEVLTVSEHTAALRSSPVVMTRYPDLLNFADHFGPTEGHDTDDSVIDLTARRAAVLSNEVTITVHTENVGFNRAVNAAGEQPDGGREVIAAFNADVAFLPPVERGAEHVIDRMYRALATPEWGVVGPRQRDSRGRLTAAGIFGTHAKPRHRGWLSSAASSEYRDVRDVAVSVAGSAMALRRDTWELLTCCPIYCGSPFRRRHSDTYAGPFLPNRHYWGDTWVCYHAAAHGLKSVYLGDVECIHDVHGADPACRFGREHKPADRARFRDACDDHRIEHD
jgi:GT2 family glycosyltransferase